MNKHSRVKQGKVSKTKKEKVKWKTAQLTANIHAKNNKLKKVINK